MQTFFLLNVLLMTRWAARHAVNSDDNPDLTRTVPAMLQDPTARRN
jgi:hypothetical protein